jgi:triacylglycerol esterase/lipase EstA (alpha/beta hydrolase family)
MMTITQLKKLAKDKLIPLMLDNGFELVNKLTFVKKGPEDIYYCVFFDISYGENLKVIAACHTDEMNDLIGTPFPNFVSSLVAGHLEPGRAISYENGHIWDVGSEESSEEALKEIIECIRESALPFFTSIDSRKKLVDFIYPSMRVNDYARVIEKILKY